MIDPMAMLSSSEKARSWAQLAIDLASEVTETMDTRDEVVSLFDAFHGLLTQSLAKVATAWNRSHDRSRVLPPELQEQCFSPLAISTKCQLALVSSHWRDATSGIPGLWNDLRLVLGDGEVDLDALLARSGHLPLALSVSTQTDQSLIRLDKCLHINAHRLQTLSISLDNLGNEDRAIFRYPAPLLEDLSLTCNGYSIEEYIKLPALMFEGQAPKLSQIRLTSIGIPTTCPALAHVTSATIHYCPGGLENLYAVMPSLQVLDLYSPRNAAPGIPANAPLHTAKLNGAIMTMDELRDLGYTKLRSLRVIEGGAIRLVMDALAQHGGEAASVEMTPDASLELELRSDRGTLHIVACNLYLAHVQHLICTANTFHAVQRLVLPRSLIFDVDTVSKRLSAELPGLRTLGMRCGRYAPYDAVLDVEFLHAPLRVPALARIELLADEDQSRGIAPVDIAHLVSFIESTLEIEDRGSVVLFVDTAHGVQLEGDMDRLRACVGTVIASL